MLSSLPPTKPRAARPPQDACRTDGCSPAAAVVSSRYRSAQGDIEQISILGGHGRDGAPDAIARLDLQMGDVVSVVGRTGSGKTTLINDIELFADADTPTGRRILIDGEPPPEEYRDDPACNPIALITQHTTFLSDLPVDEFLHTHAGIRRASVREIEKAVGQTLAFANQLTGEPISLSSRMTELSGGGRRARC
ncbi:MAG: ATP-binding cassette domain-containing protein [Roseiarcus sp.]